MNDNAVDPIRAFKLESFGYDSTTATILPKEPPSLGEGDCQPDKRASVIPERFEESRLINDIF